MAITFQCPNCGSNIADRADQSVLTCEKCGTTVTKYIQRTDQLNVNVEAHSVIRDVAEEKKQEQKKIKAKTEMITVIAIIAFFAWMIITLSRLGD